MKEIKCPHCQKVFTLNDADYADILGQIRNAEFNAELDRRLDEVKQVQQAKEAQRAAEEAARHREALGAKDQEIAALQQKIEGWEKNKGLEIEALRVKAENGITEAVAKKEEELRKKEAEITRLVSAAAAEKEKVAEREKAMREKFQAEKESLEKEVELYKSFKAKRSVKLLGEDLEQHCYALYNQMLLPVMPESTFEKDNESVKGEGETTGTKGDFIFRGREKGIEFVSIMFDMKNESDVTATKHRNADFYAKLDSDRKKKGCEYAVLVSMLEMENDLFGGINVVPGYEKMYMVRPDQFIPIITLLVQAGKKSLEARMELELARTQTADVTHFEEHMEKFKTGFTNAVQHAKERYEDAIDGIDKTIAYLQKVKANLSISAGHLDTAERKLDDLSIKKLTYKNPTMKAKFDEAREKREKEAQKELEQKTPDEQ